MLVCQKRPGTKPLQQMCTTSADVCRANRLKLISISHLVSKGQAASEFLLQMVAVVESSWLLSLSCREMEGSRKLDSVRTLSSNSSPLCLICEFPFPVSVLCFTLPHHLHSCRGLVCVSRPSLSTPPIWALPSHLAWLCHLSWLCIHLAFLCFSSISHGIDLFGLPVLVCDLSWLYTHFAFSCGNTTSHDHMSILSFQENSRG